MPQSRFFEQLISARVAMVEPGIRKMLGRRYKREKLRTAVMEEIIEAEMRNCNCNRHVAIWRLNNIGTPTKKDHFLDYQKAWDISYDKFKEFRKVVDYFETVAGRNGLDLTEELTDDEKWSKVQPEDMEWSE